MQEGVLQEEEKEERNRKRERQTDRKKKDTEKQRKKQERGKSKKEKTAREKQGIRQLASPGGSNFPFRHPIFGQHVHRHHISKSCRIVPVKKVH